MPYGWGTLASRSAVVAGSAIYQAACAVRDRILEALAEHWEVSPSDLRIRNGIVGIKGVGEAGAISPPAAIANAIEDALAGLGARVDRVPVTPRRLFEQLHGGRNSALEDLR